MASRRRHDSNEEEATAIDMREASSKVHAALANRKKVLASPNAPTKKAHLASEAPLHGGDESAEEDTEFLARPASAQSAAEDSRTAAVPRKVDVGVAAAAVPPASKEARDPSARAAPEPAELPRPVALPTALPKAPRPLPGRDQITEARPVGGTAGPTAPRITRIFASPDAQRRPTPEDLQRHLVDFDDERTAPSDPAAHKVAAAPAPPPRAPTVLAATGRDADATDPPRMSAPQPNASPPRAKTARNPSSSSTTGGGTETLEAEPADGTLIVDVPAGAVVFVNGVERGRGPSLRVRELDRYAKHAVRVHADGFTPWKGSVSLDGRVAAKVRPNLRARDR